MTSVIEHPAFVVAFYVLVIAAIILNRKRFEFQGKIMALLRTNWGVAWMQRFGEQHARIIRALGIVGIYVGYLGMLFVIGIIVWGAFQILFVPGAAPVLTPLLPGVKIPGSPIAFPLFPTLIALFITIVVHEAAHGIVAAAHGIKIRNSGLLLLGPIFGAFVEPDEEQLKKRSHRVQKSVFAAGPWSNIIGAALFLGLLVAFSMLVSPQLDPEGITFTTITPESPAEAAGLLPDVSYVAAQGQPLMSPNELQHLLRSAAPGDPFTLSTADATYTVTLGPHPEDASAPWIGVLGVSTVYGMQRDAPFLFGIIQFIESIIIWTFLIMLGLGTANLLPLGPVDGGRMWQLLCRERLGKTLGDKVWAKTSLIVLLLVIFNILVPIITALVF